MNGTVVPAESSGAVAVTNGHTLAPGIVARPAVHQTLIQYDAPVRSDEAPAMVVCEGQIEGAKGLVGEGLNSMRGVNEGLSGG